MSIRPNAENPKQGHRNPSLPPWVLTPKEEKQVFANWKEETYKKCDEFVKEFAECSQTARLFVTFSCRGPHRKMNDCISRYQRLDLLDECKDKFIKEKMAEREKENEKK